MFLPQLKHKNNIYIFLPPQGGVAVNNCEKGEKVKFHTACKLKSEPSLYTMSQKNETSERETNALALRVQAGAGGSLRVPCCVLNPQE